MGRTNARGRPVMETIVNARSETLFAKSAYRRTSRRCLMPVSGWYEWTGERRRKTRWAIRAPGRGRPRLRRGLGPLAGARRGRGCEPRHGHLRAERRGRGGARPDAGDPRPADWPLWLGETDGDPARCCARCRTAACSVEASGQ